MRKGRLCALIVVGFAVALAGCPASPGKLVLVNDSSHPVTAVNAKNLDGDYTVQLVVSEKPDTYILPGETRTFPMGAEGHYTLYATTGSGIQYYGESVYFAPGVTVTWTVTDDKVNLETVCQGVSGANAPESGVWPFTSNR
jgi:hypothetical protein